MPEGAKLGRGSQPPQLEPGDAVDQYRVVRLIGRGGMGEIYLARDTRLGRPVALKLIIPRAEEQDTRSLELFEVEARATARLNHPNIVTVYGAGVHEGNPYLALEYLKGLTLRERSRGQPLGTAEIVRIGLAIAEALAEAHRHGVLHRDLKPSNILIPLDGRPRVVDFGIARLYESEVDPDGTSAEERGGGSSEEATMSDEQPTLDGPEPPGDAKRLPALPVPTERSAAAADARAAPDDTPTVGSTSPLQAPRPSALRSGVERLLSRMSSGVGGIPFSQELRVLGTPAYMAPEQWRGDALPTTDVWAVGVILHELAAGRRPYHGLSTEDLALAILADSPVPTADELKDIPAALSDLILQCLEKNPVNRPSAEQVVAVLRKALARARPGEEDAPFRGLLPFTEQHADLFFGRSADIAAVTERLRHDAIVPIVGPSGAGKSSFVMAGVIPRLKEQGRWLVIRIRPGHAPFRILASRILDIRASTSRLPAPSLDTLTASADCETDGGREAELSASLREAPSRLAVVLADLAATSHGRIVLFVDQLEELATLVTDADERTAFLDAICSAADDPEEPVRVMFTVRDDFLGRIDWTPRAMEALGRMTLMRAPGADELYETILGPTEAVGFSFDDPELPAEIVTAVRDEAAPLPLIQFALQRLWSARDPKRRLLLRSVYESMGGIAGALATHADNILAGMTPSQVRVTRDLLIRLVTTEGTRQRLTASRALDGLGDEADHVLERLREARLLTVRKASSDGEATLVELAHESLIRSWKRLGIWLAEHHDEAGALAEMGDAAHMWERRGRREDELWQGDALLEAQRRLERATTAVPDRVRAFVEAGARRRTRNLRRRRIYLFSGVLLLVLVALGAVGAAWIMAGKEREARVAQERAEQRRAEALEESARVAAARGDSLEARARLREALEQRDSAVARTLWWLLSEDPLLACRSMEEHIYGARFFPDGRTVVAASHSGVLYLVDATTLSTRVLRGHHGQAHAVAVSADGSTIASGGEEGIVLLWNVGSGEARIVEEHEEAVVDLAFHPTDPERLASAGQDGTVRLTDLSGEASTLIMRGHEGRVSDFAFNPGGEELASCGPDGSVRLWNAETGSEIRHLVEPGGAAVFEVEYTPDGDRIAIGDRDGRIRQFDAASRRPIGSFMAHDAAVSGLRFSPDGHRMATAGYDSSVAEWSLEGELIQRLQTPDLLVRDLDYSPDGVRLVSTGHAVRFHRAGRAADGVTKRGHGDSSMGVAFSPDGASLATSGWGGEVLLWDLALGTPRAHHPVGVPLHPIAFAPDGRSVVVGGLGAIALMRLPGLTPGPEVAAPAGFLNIAASFDPSGTQIVTGGTDGLVHVWDAGDGGALSTFEGHRGRIRGVGHLAGGRIVSLGDDATLRTWEVGGPGRVLGRLGSAGLDLAVSSDGNQVATTESDGLVRLWNTEDGTDRPIGHVEGIPYSVAFHPDGDRVAVASSNGSAYVFRIDGELLLTLEGHQQDVNGVAFSPDGELIATTSDDTTVRLHRTSDGTPVWRAVGMLGDPPRLYGHRGWTSTDPADGGGRPDGEWAQAIEGRATIASDRDGTLCLLDGAGTVEVWDERADRLLASGRFPTVDRMLPLGAACAVLSRGAAHLLTDTGTTELADGVSAMALAGGSILVAAGGRVRRFDPSGAEGDPRPGADGATAVASTNDGLTLGFEEGIVLRLGPDGAEETVFEETPASAVELLLEGPADTMIVGYRNGVVGIWDPGTGRRLHRVVLHGRVVDGNYQDGRLTVVTDLGDALSIDLSALEKPYCDLLREVWADVPVVWVRGHAEERPPPPHHRCAAASAAGR